MIFQRENANMESFLSSNTCSSFPCYQLAADFHKWDYNGENKTQQLNHQEDDGKYLWVIRKGEKDHRLSHLPAGGSL